MSETGTFKILTSVEKPVGFDLNNRRAAKTDSATNWFPADALYDASRELDNKEPAKALMVAWYEMVDGEQRFKYRLYCESANDGTALGADVFRALSHHG